MRRMNRACSLRLILVLLRECSSSFNSHNVAEKSSNRTDLKGVQVETVNEKFTTMCSRSQQNLEFGHFMLLSMRECSD